LAILTSSAAADMICPAWQLAGSFALWLLCRRMGRRTTLTVAPATAIHFM
jgi:hypothetical protein